LLNPINGREEFSFVQEGPWIYDSRFLQTASGWPPCSDLQGQSNHGMGYSPRRPATWIIGVLAIPSVLSLVVIWRSLRIRQRQLFEQTMIGSARVSVVAGRPRSLCVGSNAIPVWVSGLGRTAIFLCRPSQLTLTVQGDHVVMDSCGENPNSESRGQKSRNQEAKRNHTPQTMDNGTTDGPCRCKCLFSRGFERLSVVQPRWPTGQRTNQDIPHILGGPPDARVDGNASI